MKYWNYGWMGSNEMGGGVGGTCMVLSTQIGLRYQLKVLSGTAKKKG